MEQKCALYIEHPPSLRLRRDREMRRKVMGASGKPPDDDGFAGLAQLES